MMCCFFYLSRGKAIQMHLGRLHVEVCPLWWADEALQKTHGGQALQVCRLWPQLLQIWPLGPAPTETHAGVNQTDRNKERESSTETDTHTNTHRQPGEQDLPVNVSQLAWMHTHSYNTHAHTHTRTHTLSSVVRGEDGEVHGACGAQNRVSSGSSLGCEE